MHFPISNRVLVRSLVASAVVLVGTACSRSDRTETGRDNTAVTLPDTTTSTSQPSATSPASGTESGAMGDTASRDTISSQTPSAPAQPNTPRAETAPADTAPAGDAAGYRGMERDTSTAPAEPSDSARVTEDTSETSVNTDTSTDDTTSIETAGATEVEDTSSTQDTSTTEVAVADTTATADTAAAGYSEMARDTSTTPEQADVTVPADSGVAIQATVDTTTGTNVDSAVTVGDSASVANTGERIDPVVASAETNDTLTNTPESERVRPPEDSTEVLGNATTDEAAAADTSITQEDRETVAAAEVPAEPEAEVEVQSRTDEVGAAAIGGDVTGSDAVGLISRQGIRCMVVDPESSKAVMWDMSSTPATLNPCGMGSMILTRITTAE